MFCNTTDLILIMNVNDANRRCVYRVSSRKAEPGIWKYRLHWYVFCHGCVERADAVEAS